MRKPTEEGGTWYLVSRRCRYGCSTRCEVRSRCCLCKSLLNERINDVVAMLREEGQEVMFGADHNNKEYKHYVEETREGKVESH